MKNKISRILATLVLVVVTGSCVACGASQQASVDSTAAIRGQGVGAGETYIDDAAIALAGQTQTSQNITTAATTALSLVNTQRANAGLTALQWSQGLADAAMVRAQEIVKTFSHTRPDGSETEYSNSADRVFMKNGDTSTMRSAKYTENVPNGWTELKKKD